MPGEIRADARCPVCNSPVVMMTRTSHAATNTGSVEFIHSEALGIKPCKKKYPNWVEMDLEYESLLIWKCATCGSTDGTHLH